MGLRSFVALDIETTGADPAKDRIIEIGAIRYEDGQEVAALSQLIDPGQPIPLRIQNLTGILPAMVQGKPTFGQIAAQLSELVGDLPLVAHNAGFDISLLEAAMAREGRSFANPVYDTVEFSRIARPLAKNHRLATLVQHLNIRLEQHHRAEDDARACGQIFLALLDEIQRMDVGLLRFILNLGEPAGWPLTPIFRTELAAREARGDRAKSLMQWIKPFEGQLHQPDKEAPEGEPVHVNPELVLQLLGPGGVISDAFGSYEHRPQQLQMAHQVADSFNKGSHLLMEAGTGTGKSLAYLVPAIAWSKANGEKVAIATHTINLQEQLWEKDIPFLKDALLGTKLEGFKAALVKGRPNYICLRKWEEEAIGLDFTTSEEARSFHIRLSSWLSQTDTGDKAELNLTNDDERLWADVRSETETCLGPRCKWFRNHCFAYRARRLAKDADIMVLNHAVLFADINTGNELLPPYRQLVLDEAHHVEDVATNALGIRLENWDVTGALLHLHRSAGQGFLYQIQRKLPSGQRIAARPPIGLPSEDQVEKLRDLAIASRSTSDELFRLCATLTETRGNGAEEEGGGRALRLTEQVRQGPLWEGLQNARANTVYRLRQLSQGLAALGEIIECMDPPLKDQESLLVDIQKQSGILNQSAKAIDEVLLHIHDGEVTWIEANTTRQGNQRVVLRSAPIDVGEVLKEKLFEKLRSVVLTSATLSVSGGFDHVKRRLGLHEVAPSRLATGILSSPFAYRRQALLCVPEDMPSPRSVSDKEFTKAVQDFLREYLIAAGGRTLVLFTSHRQLRTVYAAIKDDLEAEGLFLLGQGLDGSRGRLVEEFKTAHKAVLFGSASFWEGVDIPGDGLTSVIMVKLPFMPPVEPVMEARTEDLERRGLSAFAHLSLPHAVLKFKQGFGRLVRTRQDRGVVIVLDSRISPRQTRYGSQFVRSLPGPSTFAGPSDAVIERALQWLKLEEEG
jgi:ATP-dependent DNA helicase DinG